MEVFPSRSTPLLAVAPSSPLNSSSLLCLSSSVLSSLPIGEVAERLFILVAFPHVLAKKKPLGVCWQDYTQGGMRTADVASVDLEAIQIAIDLSLKNAAPPLLLLPPLAA